MAERAHTKPRRRRGRRIVLALVALLVVPVAAVLAAPTLISMGVGQGALRGAIEKRVDGTVKWDRIDLGWRGPQSVSRFQIIQPDGRTAVDVNLGLSAGLLKVVLGSMGPVQVELSGTLDGQIDEDGNVSLARLTRSKPPEPSDGAKPPAEPPSAPGYGPITVTVDALTVQLDDAVSGRQLTLEDLGGQLVYTPGDGAEMELAGRSICGDMKGSVSLSMEAHDLFDTSGGLTPSGAAFQLTALAQSVPVLFTKVTSDVERLELTASSDDLSKQLVVELQAGAVIQGAEPSRLEGQVIVERPLSADGEVTIALDRFTGTLTGERVPTGLLQPLLAAAKLNAARDLGPIIDVDATFAPGTVRSFTFSAETDRLAVSLAGRIDTAQRTVELSPSRLEGTVTPELVAALAPLTMDAPATVTVELARAALPLAVEDLAAALPGVAVEGSISLAGPVQVGQPEQEQPLGRVDHLRCAFRSQALGEQISINGTGSVDGASLQFDEQVTDLFDAEGNLAPWEARPVGRSELRGLSRATLNRFLPGQSALVEALVQQTVDLAVTTELIDRGLKARLTLDLDGGSGEPNVEVVAVEESDRVAVISARAQLVPHQRLSALWQQDTEPQQRTRLSGAPVVITIDPFELPGNRRDGLQAPPGPVVARLQADEVVVDGLAALSGAVRVQNLAGALTWNGQSQPAYIVSATGGLAPATGGSLLGSVTVAMDLHKDDQATRPSGRVAVTNASLAAWEQVLGREPRSLERWLGADGSLVVDLETTPAGYRAAVQPSFPQLTGSFEGAVENELLRVSAADATLILARPSLQQWLPAAGPGRPAPPLTATADVPVQLTARELVLPLALLKGEPFDPQVVAADLTASAASAPFTSPDGSTSTLSGLTLTIKTRDLRQGAQLHITGRSDSSTAPEPGIIDIDATLRDLLDADSRLSAGGATVELDATVQRLPSALVDSMAGFGGYLVDALGPQIDATFRAEGFSKSGGTLAASVTCPQGSLEGTVAGRDGALVSLEEPVRAELELSKPFRERLLAKLNPIFRDVRSTEQPLRATVSGFTVPLDGDVSRLTGQIDMTLGAVEIDSGSALLALLAVFNERDRSMIAGTIEPVRARIDNGVVSYDRFNVKLDKYTLPMEGRVDLSRRTIDLRSQLPLEGLALSIKELRGYADTIIVPLVARGTFEQQPGFVVDPEFDIVGAAAEAGFRGALDEVLKDKNLPIKDLVDGIFGPKKPKEPEKPDGGGK